MATEAVAPGVSDGQFAEDRAAVERDLEALKGILERRSNRRHTS